MLKNLRNNKLKLTEGGFFKNISSNKLSDEC